jgi:hypothetical protein
VSKDASGAEGNFNGWRHEQTRALPAFADFVSFAAY